MPRTSAPARLHAARPLRLASILAASALAGMLAGCAIPWGSEAASGPAATLAATPSDWSAPLPHGGNLQDLNQWWTQLGDALLVDLIASAQEVNPSITGAASRLTQARAAFTSAQSASLPALDASASVQRGVNSQSPIVGTAQQGSLNASWEIDVLGGNRASAQAAAARARGAQAQWHEARVSVAAEVASLYFNLRTCRQLQERLQVDAASRQETARLSALTTQAGFSAPATLALARASAAEGQARLRQQQSQCESGVKAMVALSGMAEASLRKRLDAAPLVDTTRVMPVVASVPASVLAQRPDLYSAEHDVAAASADIGAAQAQRYPRLMLSGSVGQFNYTNALGSTDLSTWSVGPIAVTLPLLDGGRRKAQVEAAEARYVEAASLYRARVRQAVREVEDAMQQLASADARRGDAAVAATGYAASFEATQARYKAGTASLPELEDARRITLAAQMALMQLELERSQTWVSLYRALGGGWSREATGP